MNLSTVDVNIWTAFAAGFLIFFTPCTLPLIPAWFTLVTGFTYDELIKSRKKNFWSIDTKIFWPTLFFILGFCFIFIFLGALAGIIGTSLNNYENILKWFSGIMLIFLGLYLLGIISPAFLSKEFRVNLKAKPVGLFGAFIVGMTFSFGWIPCTGPVLAAIFNMATLFGNVYKAVYLLTAFSLGMAIPYLIVALFWDKFIKYLAKLMNYSKIINKILGVLVLFWALIILTESFTNINRWFL